MAGGKPFGFEFGNQGINVHGAIERLVARLNVLWSKQHKASGAHAGITADSLAAPAITTNQIRFPAVQVPSTDPNTFDDYREGPWTPDLQFGGANTGITYTTQTGGYIKCARNVLATCRIVLSSKGSATGTATIGGLPFTATGRDQNGACIATAMAGLTSPITPRVASGATVLDLFDWGAGGVAVIDDTNFNNNSVVSVTLSYISAT